MFTRISKLVFAIIFILTQITDTFAIDQDSISSASNISDYYKYSSHISRRHRRQYNINTDQSCEIPNYPPNTGYNIINEPDSIYKPGDLVKQYSILGITCSEGYKLPPYAVNTSHCLNGQWDNLPHPTCRRACPSLRSTTSITVNCRYNGAILPDNCINPIEGTNAVFTCNLFYESDPVKRNPVRSCIKGQWSSNLPECYANCGLKSPKAILNIINGGNSTPGDYPWQAGIYTSEKDFICGGSIIDQNIVLSAAHCFADYNGNKLPKENYLITTGKYYNRYDDDRDEFAQYSTVREIFIPMRYKSIRGLNSFDIAVVILKSPLTLTLRVQPVCIDLREHSYNTDYLINNKGIVTGWGYTQEGGELPSKELKELQVPLISYEQCYREIPTDFQKFLTADKICAGHLNKSTSVCQGDSGGGLVHNIDSRYYVTGIVSTSPATQESGTAQCDSQQYSLYTAVDYHVNFIRNLVSIHSWKQSIECTKDDCRNEETENKETCRLPNFPQHGKYSLPDRNSNYEPGNSVYVDQLILLTCDSGYEATPSGVTQFYCEAKSQWNPALGICTKHDCLTPDGVAGNCIIIQECKSAVEFLKRASTITSEMRNILRRYQCGIQGKSVKVCCPDTPITIIGPDGNNGGTQTVTAPTQTTFLPPDVSNHRNIKLLPSVESCGPDQRRNRIINGFTSDLYEFPWMALLSYQTKSGPDFRCGGTLISDRYILTAAHCITNLKDFPLLGVRLGEYNISSVQDCQVEEYQNTTTCAEPIQDIFIEEIIPHPNYNFTTYTNDIGLLRLRSPAVLKESVQPICLPIGENKRNKNFTNANLIVAGWGTNARSKIWTRQSDILLKYRIPIIKESECKAVYNHTTVVINYRQLCAGGNIERCVSDSGGPLQTIESIDGHIQYVQYGVLSSGPLNCVQKGFPDVYTRIDYYMDWILGNIRA